MSETETLPALAVAPDDDAGTTPAGEAFAILVATDGRLVRLNPCGAGISLAIDGRKPVALDRWQAMALRQAVAALPEG